MKTNLEPKIRGNWTVVVLSLFASLPLTQPTNGRIVDPRQSAILPPFLVKSGVASREVQ